MKSTWYTHSYLHFLEELRATRQQANISQAELSKALKQSPAFVSKAELGDRRIDVIELYGWLVALRQSPTAFMERLAERLSRHQFTREADMPTELQAPKRKVRTTSRRTKKKE